MSIDRVSEALQLISEAVELKSEIVKTPISKREYKVSELQGSDDIILKKSTKTYSEYTENIIKTIHKHATLTSSPDIVETLDDFMDNNSGIDLTQLIYGLFISSYNPEKEQTFVCDCGNEFKISPFDYKKHINIEFKEWDKDKPFNEYVVKYEKQLSDKIKLIFDLRIPSLRESITLSKIFEKSLSTELIQPSLVEAVVNSIKTLYVEKLVVENIDGVEKETRVVDEFTNVYDIKIIVEKIPHSILKEIIDKFNEEFDDYTPKYKVVVKCDKCGKNIEIPFSPETALLSKIFGI